MERGNLFKGNDPVRLFVCFAGGPGDWQQRERGSDLSPSPRPPPRPPPPPAPGNKELAGALMEVTGNEGIWTVKFLLPFKRGPRGALGQGEASRSGLGVGGSSWSWPSRW